MRQQMRVECWYCHAGVIISTEVRPCPRYRDPIDITHELVCLGWLPHEDDDMVLTATCPECVVEIGDPIQEHLDYLRRLDEEYEAMDDEERWSLSPEANIPVPGSI